LGERVKTPQQLLGEVLALKKVDDESPHPYAFIREGEQHVTVSGEDGGVWCDYWAAMWIDPQLQALAERNRMFWEWENAACIGLYPV